MNKLNDMQEALLLANHQLSLDVSTNPKLEPDYDGSDTQRFAGAKRRGRGHTLVHLGGELIEPHSARQESPEFVC